MVDRVQNPLILSVISEPLAISQSHFGFYFQLQRYLHDILLDQLSPLAELKYWLAKLASSQLPHATRRPLLLEVVPQVLSNLNCNQWPMQNIYKLFISFYLHLCIIIIIIIIVSESHYCCTCFPKHCKLGYSLGGGGDIQNYWLYPSSRILNTRKHNVLETGSVSIFR
jgi:hypothetical protein